MTDDHEIHAAHLQSAIALSRARMEAGLGGPFGAIVARGAEVVAEGWNQVTTRNDPTAHAEIEAIREACRRLGRFHLRGHVLYTSCEPCPMCLGAIYWAHLDAVYYANTRADAAAIGFDDDHIYHELELPIAGRSVPFVHLPSDQARAAFRAWQDKPDKVRY